MRVKNNFGIYVSATSKDIAYLKLKQIFKGERKPDGGIALDKNGSVIVCPYVDFVFKIEDIVGADVRLTPLSLVDISKYEKMNISALRISSHVKAKALKILQEEKNFKVTRCIWGGLESTGLYISSLRTVDNAPTNINYDVIDNYGEIYASDVSLSEALKLFRKIAKNLKEKQLMIAPDYTLRIVSRDNTQFIAGLFTWRLNSYNPFEITNGVIKNQAAYILIGSFLDGERI